jgi:hypothetical protein
LTLCPVKRYFLMHSAQQDRGVSAGVGEDRNSVTGAGEATNVHVVGWFHLAESVVRSLAWPAVVLVLGFAFKAEISALIARLRGIKIPGGGEALFAPVLDEAEVLVERSVKDLSAEAAARRQQSEAAPENASASGDGGAEDESAMVAGDPTSSVLRAYAMLEESVLTLRRAQTSIRGRPPLNLGAALAQLLDARVVNTAFVEAAQALRKLRNSAAHGEAVPSESSARVYVRTALELRRTAQALMPRDKPTNEEGPTPGNG